MWNKFALLLIFITIHSEFSYINYQTSQQQIMLSHKISSGGGAITEVSSQRASSGNNNNVDSGNLAFPNNVTSGNTITVHGAAWNSTAAPTGITVTSTCSSTLTTKLGDIPSGKTWRTFIARGVITSTGSCTVTVNPSDASNSFSFSIDEWANFNASPDDVDGGTTSGAMTSGLPFTASDSITTVATNTLIIGVMSHDSDTTGLTAGSGYTTIGENETNSGNQCHHAVFKLVTSAGVNTVTVDGANSVITDLNGWAMQTHSFKP